MVVNRRKELSRKPPMAEMQENGIKADLFCGSRSFRIPVQSLLHHRFIHCFDDSSVFADFIRRAFGEIVDSCPFTAVKEFNRGLGSAFVDLQNSLTCIFSFVL